MHVKIPPCTLMSTLHQTTLCSKRVEAIKIGEIYEPSPSLLWAAGHSQTEQQKVNAKKRQEMPSDDLQDSLIATPQIQYPAPPVPGAKLIFGGPVI